MNSSENGIPQIAYIFLGNANHQKHEQALIISASEYYHILQLAKESLDEKETSTELDSDFDKKWVSSMKNIVKIAETHFDTYFTEESKNQEVFE